MGATSATTAGASSSLCGVAVRHRPSLAQACSRAPTHGEQLGCCVARVSVTSIDNNARVSMTSIDNNATGLDAHAPAETRFTNSAK